MTRLRHEALTRPGNWALAARVRRGAISAAVLRTAIAALSLVLIVLGVRLGP